MSVAIPNSERLRMVADGIEQFWLGIAMDYAVVGKPKPPYKDDDPFVMAARGDARTLRDIADLIETGDVD